MAAEYVVSGLVTATGLIAAGVGVVAARSRFRRARRAFRRTTLLWETMPEGWAAWFFEGFSAVTMGTRWLWAAVVLASWTIAGACFVYLGLRLF